MPDDTADLLTLIADADSPIGRDMVTAFLAACEADAAAHDGRVSVSRVSAALPEDITSTERYSSLWSRFTGKDRPMRRIPGVWDIREGSRTGNDGKPTPAREWRG